MAHVLVFQCFRISILLEGLGGSSPAVCSRMSFVPAHTTVKRSQNHADPPIAAVKFDLSSTPEQAACAMKTRRRTQDVLERGRTHAARRRPTSTDSSGRGRLSSGIVVDDAHAEAIRKLGTILGLEITVRASEDERTSQQYLGVRPSFKLT